MTVRVFVIFMIAVKAVRVMVLIRGVFSFALSLELQIAVTYAREFGNDFLKNEEKYYAGTDNDSGYQEFKLFLQMIVFFFGCSCSRTMAMHTKYFRKNVHDCVTNNRARGETNQNAEENLRIIKLGQLG